MKRAVLALCFCCVLSGAVFACTGVALVGEGAVVVGGNEDNSLRNPAMWATAATPGRYGALYFGFMFAGALANRRPASWYEMQGVNDQGLFFDLFSMPCTPGVVQTTSYRWTSPGFVALEPEMMETCATVDEGLAFLHEHDYASVLLCAQVLLVDRAGNTAVYTGGRDVFRSGPGFVVTNFNLAHREYGEWPCGRYNVVTRMIGQDASPTLDRAGQMLKAARIVPTTSDEGGTRYSVVCDLVNGIVDVYTGWDFMSRARLDASSLWANGGGRTWLSNLAYAPSGLP